MDRRTFISGGAVAAATVATACGETGQDTSGAPVAPNINRGVTRLRMVTTWPANFPGLGTAANNVADYINRMSGGSLDVRVYAAGEIVSAFEAFDAVSEGTADMYHGAEYYWQGKSPAFNFFTAVPMGMTAYEIMGWVEAGGGQALWDELSGQFNIKPFQAGNTGHQMGGWFKREINSLEDFRGLRMRIPGLGGNVLRELGGAAVTLSGGEIYPALQSGAIDGTEWVGPWNDLAFGFYREAPFYYGPGFHEPGSALAVGMNKTVWDGLASDHQAIIATACQAANNLSIAEFQYQNGIALDVLVNEHGIEQRQFSDEIWSRTGEIAEQVVADTGNADAFTRRVYDSYLATRDSMRGWGRISEMPYMVQRERVLGR
ncbi:TRAP transporter substrate-binding protein [Maricaulis sp.]|uniref:TRAP transporter substrate-binding protein n=1 Tax=Maricaulis sp. TaxID=1486257 RepID=UPI002B27906C|nr:TRAP transporter substrate-binding protein [Maricaulis sp.]